VDLTYWPDRETYRRIRGDYAHLDEGLVAAMCDANREASASENVRWRQVRQGWSSCTMWRRAMTNRSRRAF